MNDVHLLEQLFLLNKLFARFHMCDCDKYNYKYKWHSSKALTFDRDTSVRSVAKYV